MAGGHFLPDDGTHIIKTDTFTKLDDFRSYWDNLISSIINGTCELVAYINAKATALM
jgi:hypothetical protein